MGNPLSKLKKSIQNKEVLLPILRNFLREEHRKGMTESGVHANAVREDARLAAACFKEREEEYNHGDANPYKGYFHPSALGVCRRQLFYSDYDAPVDKLPLGQELLQSHLVFETGTYTHVLFQNLCERAGVLDKREYLIVDHKNALVGHGDGILKIPGKPKWNLEIKTINSRGFSALNGPKVEHTYQATAYMHVQGLSATVFVYLEKDRHGVKEFLFEYDDKLWKETVLPRIQEYMRMRKNKQLPEREGSTPSAFPCLYCNFTKVCFDSNSGEVFNNILARRDVIDVGVQKVKKKRFKIKPKTKVRKLQRVIRTKLRIAKPA